MENRAFDNLARVVANRGPRRGVLRGLAGALAALTLGRSSPGAAAQGYLSLGDACWDGGQCAQSQMTVVVCADNGFSYDGPLNCCTYDYGDCWSDEGCCGDLVCVGGTCGAYPLAGQGGLPLGVQCYSTDQCIGGGISTACADNGGFVDACCLYDGQPCSQPLDCCMPGNCIGGICQ